MSVDFLGFKFGKSVYASMMEEQVAKKGKMCAVMCHLKTIEGIQVVWLTHDFTFFGAPRPPCAFACGKEETIFLVEFSYRS